MSFVVIAFFEDINHLKWGMEDLKLLIFRNSDIAATSYMIERKEHQ